MATAWTKFPLGPHFTPALRAGVTERSIGEKSAPVLVEALLFFCPSLFPPLFQSRLLSNASLLENLASGNFHFSRHLSYELSQFCCHCHWATSCLICCLGCVT